MTKNEHKLIVQMFIQQTRMFSALIAVLESREILQKSDLEAYDALLSADESQADEIGRDLETIYRGFATAFGVKTGLSPAVRK